MNQADATLVVDAICSVLDEEHAEPALSAIADLLNEAGDEHGAEPLIQAMGELAAPPPWMPALVDTLTDQLDL